MFGQCNKEELIGNVVSICRGASPRPISEYITKDSEGINWIKIGDVSDDSLYITSAEEKITKEGASKSRLVHKGDFILSNSMSFGRPYILGIDGCVHDGWLILSKFSETFNEIFLYYALKSDYVQNQFRMKVNGATVKNLNSDLVKNTKIKVPPIEKQMEFSNFIEQIDKSKFLLQQILEKLELLKKSRFIEMFGQCNKEELIGNVVSICRGASPRPISEYITKDSEGINWIKIGDVSDDSLYITSAEEKITKEGASKSRLVHKGDFILSNSMSFGRPYILGIDGCVHDGWLILSKFSETFNEIFLYYALKSDYVQNQFRMKVNGATVKNLNSDLVKNTKIKVPPIEKQMEFSNFIEQIDKSKFLLQQILEKLELLKKSRFIELIGNIQNPKYQLVELNEICEFIKDGTHQTPIYTEDRVNGFKFLSSKDVTSQKINWSNIKYIPKELHEQLYAKLSPKRGDILLAKNGTTGVAAVVDSDEIFDIYVSLALLRPKSGVNVSYLCSALNSEDLKRQFNSSLKGIGVPNLHLREIKKARIIFPPIDIQNKISSITKQIDKSKLIIQKALEDLVGKV